MLATYALCSVIACTLAWWAIIWHRNREERRVIVLRHGCKPPKLLPNKWFPPFGLDKLAIVMEAEKTKTYPLSMTREHELHGDTYTQWGGTMYTVITREPENIREILSRQFDNFEIGPARHGCVMPLLGHGIFTQDGHEWLKSRKLLAPLIQRPTLPDLRLPERHFQRLVQKITASKQSHIDLQPLLLDLALEFTTDFLLGDVDGIDNEAQSGSQTEDWRDSLVKEFGTAYEWIASRERLKIFYWLVDGRAFRQACQRARQLVEGLVMTASRNLNMAGKASAEYVALAPLLQDPSKASEVRDQVMNLLLAGRDTSGALLSWVFYILSRDVALLEAVRKEIVTQLGGDKSRCPTQDDIRRMPVLDNFLTETLRLFPPVPINGRFSKADTYLPRGGGSDAQSPMFLPKGSLVAFSTFATHRSKTLYGNDADRFRIGRWDDVRTKDRRLVDWSYHPFIGGPRKCLGERTATIQAKYLICRMVQQFEHISATNEDGVILSAPDGGVWEERVRYEVSLTMTPAGGVWVRLKD